MSKKYLGIICLLYSGILSYLLIYDKLKNYLAPQMQIYIKISIIPLLIIGLVMIFNNKVNYTFKISDIILILPLILLITSSDGRLTASLANNRTTQQKKEQRIIKTNDNKEELEQKEEEPPKENYDFSNTYFDIIDETYSELSNYITYSPNSVEYEGEKIRVRGFTIKYAPYLPDGYFAIGKYEISCCAADSTFTGFIAKYDTSSIRHNTWYEIEGILRKGQDKEGYDIMYIEVINIKDIDSTKEEEYIYPCYAYDGGKCKEIQKYNLKY